MSATSSACSVAEHLDEAGAHDQRRAGGLGQADVAEQTWRRLLDIAPLDVAARKAVADIRLAATLEFLQLADAPLPTWAADYLARVEAKLGKAYSEPAGDVRGFVASKKS